MTTLPTYLRFADLRARGIVRNLTTLQRLIDTQDFPAGVRLGANTRAWTETEVQDWLTKRPSGKKPAPKHRA
jgi:hypothetical protein